MSKERLSILLTKDTQPMEYINFLADMISRGFKEKYTATIITTETAVRGDQRVRRNCKIEGIANVNNGSFRATDDYLLEVSVKQLTGKKLNIKNSIHEAIANPNKKLNNIVPLESIEIIFNDGNK